MGSDGCGDILLWIKICRSDAGAGGVARSLDIDIELGGVPGEGVGLDVVDDAVGEVGLAVGVEGSGGLEEVVVGGQGGGVDFGLQQGLRQVSHFFDGKYIILNPIPCFHHSLSLNYPIRCIAHSFISPMDLVCQHIGANCNPMPNTLQFLDDQHIVFCFSNQVALYSLTQNTILLNLNSIQIEANRANCLACVSPTQVLVGYDSGHVVFFCQSEPGHWVEKQVVKQNGAITLIHFCDGMALSNNTVGEVIIYSVSKDGLQQVEEVKFPLNKMIESAALGADWLGNRLLFLGGVDQKIHCYIKQGKQPLRYCFGLSGHENAITKITVAKEGEDLLVASASKDGYIRLWRLTKDQELRKFHKNVKQLGEMICFLDAVLISHECSVTDLEWVRIRGKLELASCSLDCTICVWGKEEEGAWSVETRMGQFLGNKNSYFSIQSNPSGTHLVAVNYIGSAMIWEYSREQEKFQLLPSFNGHYMEVRGAQWNHTGDFLVSASKDQTTRIISRNESDGRYHEISRAQIHGYDINAVVTIKIANNVVDLIACGADQKVVRIIEPPACFANYLNYSTKANLHLYFPTQEEEAKYLKKNQRNIVEYETYAEGGTQVLGLMTKMQRVEREKITSYYDDEQEEAVEEDQETEGLPKEIKINFEQPPHDDYLVKHTLWPEMNKLYAHPHEISYLAKCDERNLLVSSCSGLNKISCSIIVWSTKDWKVKKIIEHHTYTVYGMDFSPCGNYLASVSKDRKLAIFDSDFELVFSYEAHTRAATCVSFSLDSKFVATGSRDKFVKITSLEKKSAVAQFQMKKPVVSIAYCGNELIAVGCVDGAIVFLQLAGEQLSVVGEVPREYGHTKAVESLSWKKGLLASAGQDHSVRVFKVGMK